MKKEKVRSAEVRYNVQFLGQENELDKICEIFDKLSGYYIEREVNRLYCEFTVDRFIAVDVAQAISNVYPWVSQRWNYAKKGFSNSACGSFEYRDGRIKWRDIPDEKFFYMDMWGLSDEYIMSISRAMEKDRRMGSAT